MNSLGLLVAGASLRAAVVAGLGVVVYAILKRGRPAEGAFAALTSLSVMTVLVALAPSPYPRWSWTWPIAEAKMAAAPSTATAQAAGASPVRKATTPRDPRTEATSWRSNFAGAFAEAIRQPSSENTLADNPRWGWAWWVAAAYLAVASLLTARIAMGLWGVRRIVHRAKLLRGEAIETLAATIRGEMALTRAVAVLESGEITAPATVGAIKPVVLVPRSWREWDTAQTRAILAHELAHVKRGDYAAGLWAQACLAVNALQPLAYWFASRLRLEQELAADAWGARIAGGNRPYLYTLARLAMGQDQRAMAWPSRAFLPVPGTLSRRIEMLRDSRPIDVFSHRPRRLALAGSGLVLACLAMAGVREPLAQASPTTQKPAAVAARADAIDLSAVPPGTRMMLAMRPGEILGRPGFEALGDLLGPDGQMTRQMGIRPEQVEQITMVWLDAPPLRRGGPDLPEPSVAIVRAAVPHDWKKWTSEQVVRSNPEPTEFAGQRYTRAAGAPNSPAFYLADDRTLVIGFKESGLKTYITARKVENPRHVWDDAWQAAGQGQVGLAVDSAFLAQIVEPMMGPGGQNTPLDAFAPLWSKAYSHAFKISAGETLSLNFASQCGTDPGAEEVVKTLEAALTLGRNLLGGLSRQTAEMPRPAVDLLKLAVQVVESAKVDRTGQIVRLSASSSTQVVAMVKNVLVPAAVAARSAARRAQSVNNLKQIGLAMHNYASNNDNKFPPAVVMGRDGKTPHSWRVELLPYLDQQQLFDQYRMNEPWDSPANRKVLEQMPLVYHCPNASDGGDKPTTASYFALVGPETMFPPDGDGTSFAEVTDGLSNTILVVEAQRDIPWTKPEDIALEKGQPVPDLGGYFPETPGNSMLLGDGAVKFIAKTIDAKTLRELCTKAGGEPATFP